VFREFDLIRESGWILSSEGVKDWAVPHYHIGSNKELPAWGATAPFWTVPLQHLVYHDALVSAWWEGDSYDWARQSGGHAVEQSLLDLLYADPALIFPVGRQYYFKPGTTESGVDERDIDIEQVQDAARRAVTVARHFERLGLEEMLEHRFLSPDGAVQEITFSSGTRVAVNFGTEPHSLGSGNILAPKGFAVL